jgi:hypothetical protein
MPVLAVPTTYPVSELAAATALLPSLNALRATILRDCIQLNW